MGFFYSVVEGLLFGKSDDCNVSGALLAEKLVSGNENLFLDMIEIPV